MCFDLNDFHLMFKKRVIDEFLQKWYNDMNMCNYLPMLKHCKINFDYAMYFHILSSKLRYILTKLRLSSHKIRIESVRYKRNRPPIVFNVMLTTWKIGISFCTCVSGFY